MKKYMLTFVVACGAITVFANEFVKQRKQPRESTTSVRAECGAVVADILELAHDCAQHGLHGQRTVMDMLRSWLVDDDSFLVRASKEKLCEQRDKLVLLKKRYQKVNAELQAITTELKLVEAASQ